MIDFFEEPHQNLYKKYLRSVFTFISYRVFLFSSVIFITEQLEICHANGESDKYTRICMHMINWHSINRSFTLQIAVTDLSPQADQL